MSTPAARKCPTCSSLQHWAATRCADCGAELEPLPEEHEQPPAPTIHPHHAAPLDEGPPAWPLPKDNPLCACTNGLQMMFCRAGHMTECHAGFNCARAGCSHLRKYDIPEAEIAILSRAARTALRAGQMAPYELDQAGFVSVDMCGLGWPESSPYYPGISCRSNGCTFPAGPCTKGRKRSAAPPPCRRCTECNGQDHHWLSEPVSDDDPDHPDRIYWVCKHCPARVRYDAETVTGWPVRPKIEYVEEEEEAPASTSTRPRRHLMTIEEALADPAGFVEGMTCTTGTLTAEDAPPGSLLLEDFLMGLVGTIREELRRTEPGPDDPADLDEDPT